jgi:signal transduction histidine kinase
VRRIAQNQLEFRRRARPIIAFFVLAQIVMLLVGVAGLECVDIVRAFVAGEARWSRAEKVAIIDVVRFVETRRPSYFSDFRSNMALMVGDNTARSSLELTAPDIAAAERGFITGQNDPRDVSGLAYGFLFFHNLPPFARAIAVWRNTDTLVAELQKTGDAVHALAQRGGRPQQWEALRQRALSLDRQLTDNAAAYSARMGDASRFTKLAVAATYLLMALLACAFWVWRVRAVVNAGADAERRVIEHHERLADFIVLASDWFCELDRDMQVAFASANFPVSETGSAAVLMGAHWRDVFEAAKFVSERGTDGSGLFAALESRTEFRGQRIRQSLADGTNRTWSLAGKPLHDGDEFAGFRISANDVTNFIETQSRLSQARDEAERANRAKSTFLANMGHELRTPLNAILGFSELIEDQMFGEIGNPKYVGYAQDIGFAGHHLLDIINGLLDHARIESGNLELREQPFDLAETIRSMELMCRGAALKNNTKLTMSLSPDLPLIMGDELRIRQSLINIVSNAIKFSPDASVEVCAACDDGIVIAVRDTGIGMTDDELTCALEPFGQVDNGLNRRFEGTGLGLPLTKGLIRLHDGELDIQSSPGKGTVVTIRLPASRIVRRRKTVAA